MVSNINPAFHNNVNTVAIRADGTMGHLYTDRPIDFNGDGVVEKVSVTTTQRGGNKVKNVAVFPSGVARSLIKEKFENDHGINISGTEFTTGVQ